MNDLKIGLEVHVQLRTNSKLFCYCKTSGTEIPNSRTCPTCLGYPGSRPELNIEAVKKAIKSCVALNCDMSKKLIFSRKSYFYPDMSKNFQITQFEEPLGNGGFLQITNDKILLKRVHIEEDPASINYPKKAQNSEFSLIDFNRSGNPLIEVVTNPMIKDAKSAKIFLRKLLKLLKYVKVFDEKYCLIKVDANVSIKGSGFRRVEVKNISSFKDVEKALLYEITRQKNVLRQGREIVIETRGYDNVTKTTYSLRVKEDEAEYGYISEPDIPIIVLKPFIKNVINQMPELSEDKFKRFKKEYDLTESDARVISNNLELSDFFEEVVKKTDSKIASKWIRRELLRVMNYNKIDFENLKLKPTQLIELIELLKKEIISDKVGQKMMEELVITPFSPRKRVKEKNLEKINENQVLIVVKKVLKNEKKAVKDFKEGEVKALKYLTGQAMRESKGRANPKMIETVLKKELIL